MIGRNMSTKSKNLARAWIIWLLSALFMFYKFVLEVSPSVMTNTLMSAFDISGVQLGNFAACYFYAYLLLQIPAGLLLDRFGPRKVTPIAIAVCAAGAFLFAGAETLFVACAGRFLIGVGAAFGAVNAFKLIANWFPHKQFAFMSGLMITVAMLGAVGGQAPLAAFIAAVEWRHAIEVLAVIGLALAVVFYLIVRDESPTLHEAPIKELSFSSNLKQIFKRKETWWISLYSGFAFAPVMVFGGLWGVAFTSQSYGLSSDMAAQAVSLIFIGFAVGCPIFGWFSDWIERRKIVVFWGTLVSLICISLVVYAPSHSHSLLMAALFVFGFAISSYALSFTMIREIVSPKLAASAVGFMNAFNALFGAFSDPLTGKLLDVTWDGKMVDGARFFSLESYEFALAALPIYLIISLLILFFVRETYKKDTFPSTMP